MKDMAYTGTHFPARCGISIRHVRDIVSTLPFAPSDTVSKLARPFEEENISRRVKADRASHRSLFDRFSAQPSWGRA